MPLSPSSSFPATVGTLLTPQSVSRSVLDSPIFNILSVQWTRRFRLSCVKKSNKNCSLQFSKYTPHSNNICCVSEGENPVVFPPNDLRTKKQSIGRRMGERLVEQEVKGTWKDGSD